jgi:hypothetical protein
VELPRRAAGVVVAVVALLALGASTPLPASAAADPAVELAQRYAPVVRLVEQLEPCGHGEPYEPANVDDVLGTADVALRGPWDTTSIFKVAPTARDLSQGLFGYHLDFPGNATSPGCSYDEWSHRVAATSQPTTYAHVVTESSHPGQLALQYWFFYLFNDFNDKHEGDWEMIQLNFDAATAASALTVEPTLVGFSQHEGAEAVPWGDARLQLVDGTHPVVYPALGSHANYYSSKLYLGRSAAQGVGCDNTLGPSRELRPAVSLVPTARDAYLDAFPWLGYDGRWGEAHAGFYNGPTGPNTKQQWTAPLTWADTSWRGTSFPIPASTRVGPSATDFFCGAVAFGSSVLTLAVGNPAPVLIALAAIAGLVLWLTSRTRWDLSAPFPLRRQRPWGSIVTSARRMYTGHLRLFVGIGLLFVPLGLITAGVQYLLFRLGSLSPLVESVGASNAFVAFLAILLGLPLTLAGIAIVETTTALAMVELDQGRDVGVLSAFRTAIIRIPAVIGALAIAIPVVVVANLTLIGLPLGIWLTVRWGLISQVAAVEAKGVRGCLGRSSQLVRGHWWRTASLTLFVTGVGLALGPLVGTLLLFTTSASFNIINLISSLVLAITIPFVAIATTYLYFDLTAIKHDKNDITDAAGVLPAEV